MTFDRAVRCVVALAASVFAVSQAAAQNSAADFFRGKTITISVGFTAGGGYDLHARTLARVLGKHVPGSPNIVVKNVPGAAGLVLVNSLYNALPRDGTESRPSTAPCRSSRCSIPTRRGSTRSS